MPDRAPSRSPRADVILGNRDRATTLGVNWYLNPFAKLMFNWVRFSGDNTPLDPVGLGQDDGELLAHGLAGPLDHGHSVLGTRGAFLDGCPVIEVPGRVHPVEIGYRPGSSLGDASLS